MDGGSVESAGAIHRPTAMDGGSVENAGAIHRPGGSWSVIKAPHIAPLI